MRLISNTMDRQVWLHHWQQADRFSLPFPSGPFACMLFIVDADIPADERERCCKYIVSLGCTTINCWGRGCNIWETAIDIAHVESDPNFNPPEHINTISHPMTSIKEAIDETFMASCPRNERYHTRYLILIIGHDPMITEEVVRCIPHPA